MSEIKDLEQAFFILEHGSSEGLQKYLKAIEMIKEQCVRVVRCKECVKRPPATARNGDKPTSDCPLWCGYCFGIDDNYGGEFFCGVGARE